MWYILSRGKSTLYYRFELWTSSAASQVTLHIELLEYKLISKTARLVTVKDVKSGTVKSFNPQSKYPFASPSIEEAKAMVLGENKQPKLLLDMWTRQLARLVDQAEKEYNEV